MTEDKNKNSGFLPRPARSLAAAANFVWRGLARFTTHAPDGPRDDEMERLHDLQWQIADNARRSRDLLDAQTGLIVRRDNEGRVVFANRAYLRVFGLSEEEIAGSLHAPQVIETDDQAKGSRVIERVATIVGPRWIEWEDAAGDVAQHDSTETQRTGRDITEDRRIAAELRSARDAALDASRAKSRFLAAMSHEIRTPMNGIIGMSDLLLNEALTADQMSYVRAIDQSGRALMSLIDEILDFSRIEAGKLVLANAAFSINDTVENCVALLEPKVLAKGLAVRSVIEPTTPIQIMGDESRVRQILLNLLSNAVKFTDVGSITVLVRTINAEPATGQIRIELSVADTGIGLDAADLEGIFSEFEQADEAVRRQDGGSGLGLAIARQIARAMGGDITVKSVPRQGSTFTAELNLSPVATACETAKAAGCKAMPDTGSRAGSTKRTTARVLLAEDNAVNALLATRLLQREGCEVTRVQTGDQAVAAVARTLSGQAPDFDLVLMDIYMPRLDGIAATRAIRRLLETSGEAGAAALPIVAVTANAFAEDRNRYLAAGMDDYLAKPFDGRALSSLLSRWLRPDRRGETSAA